jgi:cGMP-dependent protein kinase
MATQPQQEPDLHLILNSREEDIKKLKLLLNEREEEIQELRSQLDKYKSVLSLRSDGFISPAAVNLSRPRKNRLLGISAEPQTLLTFQELIQTKFAEYPKSQQLVIYLINNSFNSSHYQFSNLLKILFKYILF